MVRTVYLVLIGCCLLLAVAGLASASGLDPQLLGSLGGGTPYAIAVQGDYAYVASGAAALVLDISDPAAPTLVGQCYVGYGDQAFDIAQAGHYAYLAANVAGLIVLDVSDPHHPVEVGHVDTPGRAFAVTVVGSYAYVSDDGKGLCIIDISDPTVPEVIASYDTAGWTYDAVVVNGYAYLADDEAGVRVVDVRDPAAPSDVAVFPDFINAYAVARVGDYVYVGSDLGVSVLQVSNPAAPVAVGGVACTADDIIVSGSHAYALDRYGSLSVLDISSPASPTVVGSLAVEGHPSGGTVVDGHLLMTNGSEGVQTIDVSSPTAPVLTATYRTYGHAASVAISGDHAFVANGQVSVVDLGDPTAPAVTASIADDDATLQVVRAAGTRLYALGSTNDAGSLDAYDIADPDAPQYLGETWLIRPQALAVSGDIAYVAEADDGLTLIGLSDPTNPQHIGTWRPSDPPATCVAVAGHYAYIGDRDYGLRVIDVSHGTTPVEIGSWAAPDAVWAVAATDDTVYVAAGAAGLRVLDVQDPTHPVEISSYESGTTAWNVVVSGSYAFLTTSYGLQVVGITNRLVPLQVGEWPAGPAWAPSGQVDLAVSGDRLCLAAWSWGLLVFGLQATFPDVPIDSWASDAVERCARNGVVTGYEDGSYQPSESVTRDQMAVYLARTLAGGEVAMPTGPATASFSDVPPDYWAYPHIEYAALEHVISGYADGTYRPSLVADRRQMAVYVARGMVRPEGDAGLPEPTSTSSFTDVPSDAWGYRQIEYCASQGVVTGYWDGTYRPDDPVTRDQMAVYLARAFLLGG